MAESCHLLIFCEDVRTYTDFLLALDANQQATTLLRDFLEKFCRRCSTTQNMLDPSNFCLVHQEYTLQVDATYADVVTTNCDDFSCEDMMIVLSARKLPQAVHLQNIIEKERHLAKHQAANVDYKAYEQRSAENSSALCNTTEQNIRRPLVYN